MCVVEVLDNIPIKLDLEAVLKRMHARSKNASAEKSIQELIQIVHPIARPKAVYEVSYIENKSEDSLDIGGMKFTSRVLRINLDKVERVFPYVVTCGKELYDIDIPSNELLKGYLLDQIRETILVSARKYLEDYLIEKYALGQLSRMSPGSGSTTVWPITQQKQLFSIFGNVEELIGVRLTTTMLMIPVKSVSGIFFPTEIKFETCQLCPRDRCIGRRAPYDPDLEKKYQEKLLR